MVTGEILVKVKPDTKALDKELKKPRKFSIGGLFGLGRQDTGQKDKDKKESKGLGIISNGIRKMVGGIALVGVILSGLSDFLKPVFSLLSSIIKILFIPLIPILKPVLILLGLMARLLVPIMLKINKVVAGVVEGVGDEVKDALLSLPIVGPALREILPEEELPPVKPSFDELIETITGVEFSLGKSFDFVVSKISGGGATIADTFSALSDRYFKKGTEGAENVGLAGGLISDAIGLIGPKVKISIKNGVEPLASIGEDLIKDTINPGFDPLKTIGEEIKRDTLLPSFSILADAIKNFAASIASKISSFFGFGGKRAHGGPVSSNKAFLVGERGPELFVPNTSGNIIPNGASIGGGGSSITQNISIQATINNDMDIRNLAVRLAELSKDELAMSTGSQRF